MTQDNRFDLGVIRPIDQDDGQHAQSPNVAGVLIQELAIQGLSLDRPVIGVKGQGAAPQGLGVHGGQVSSSSSGKPIDGRRQFRREPAPGYRGHVFSLNRALRSARAGSSAYMC
jgi:hypothetical protein